MLPRLLACLLFVACLMCAGVSPVRADALYPTTITFDNLSPGRTNASTNLNYPSIFSIQGTGPRTGFNVLQRGEYRVASLAQATTQPNAAFGVGPLVNDPSFNSLEVRFVGFATNLVSLSVVGTQSGQTAPWELLFYSTDRTLLHSVSGTTDQFITFSSSMNNIFFFRFYASTNNEGLDTITYNAPVPEPTTIALFGTGLIALGAFRKRRTVS